MVLINQQHNPIVIHLDLEAYLIRVMGVNNLGLLPRSIKIQWQTLLLEWHLDLEQQLVKLVRCCLQGFHTSEEELSLCLRAIQSITIQVVEGITIHHQTWEVKVFKVKDTKVSEGGFPIQIPWTTIEDQAIDGDLIPSKINSNNNNNTNQSNNL